MIKFRSLVARTFTRAAFVFAAAISVATFAASHASAQAPEKRALTLDDIFKFKRVSDPQVSPDGRHVVYVVSEVLFDENRTQSDLWLVETTTGKARALTNTPKSESHPRWSPDGQWIAFQSNRDGDTQLWLLPFAGGEARRLTSLSTGAENPVWSPAGDRIAFISEVFSEFSDQPFAEADRLNREKLDAREKSKVKARVVTQLLYRHWDSWNDGRRKHLFVVGVQDGAAAGEPRNVTPGENDAVPTSSTFSCGDDFAFSPDGRSLAFTAPPLPLREQAWSTNHDLWLVDLATLERRQLTTNPGADGAPRFSPDGRQLAYRAQARSGFEADKWELRVLDLASGQHRSLTAAWDRSAEDFLWAPDGGRLYFTAQEAGAEPIWSVAADGASAPMRHSGGGVSGSLSLTADGGVLVFSHHDATRAAEVHALNLAGGADAAKPRTLTATNASLVASLQMNSLESVTVKAPDGADVQMWLLKPPGFDATKKHPLVFWVHGGPQGAWMDAWGYRWNPQLWAAQGYVIALPNPRGSTGFGQRFTDEISRDWGGKVFADLMACMDWLEKQPYIDATRAAAAGASYGGYMMNWFQGHTDRFRTLITHCGVYNLESMYGTTEEIWFAEWDSGMPWRDADQRQWSPHLYAANFKTPNLIIHNDLDFRVPLSEGMQLFTALQRQGVPSKLVMFPDEGHWVNKPQNSQLWHREIFAWLAEYLR
ncbi:MAG: S9 family peptidase [Candidatus Didemnitutus sp.]|nr:S9 family peptidase [Candidatus Didemnitutus sp.]